VIGNFRFYSEENGDVNSIYGNASAAIEGNHLPFSNRRTLTGEYMAEFINWYK
jgi:hypothetical protein